MPKTLLYVDDDARRREVVEERLRQVGYRVVTAANGDDALVKFNAEVIDLAIVDYYMPGMCGDLVAMEMKSKKPEVPVIIFSGTFTLSEMVVAFVDGFISTSDEPGALLEKVAEVLAPRRNSRAS
ncbi:MAG TPA: response regulator [Terriglobales bacterium]|jgi:OmpR family response regulator RpaB|nr:response regulator [Terriglobales bacterium]